MATPTEPAHSRPPATDVPQWVREHYALVDAADLDRYIQDFSPAVRLRFANNPVVHGREAAREALAHGHTHHDMAHTIVGCFEVGATVTLEFEVTYSFRDGSTATVPSCAVIHRDADGLLDDVRIYLDLPRR